MSAIPHLSVVSSTQETAHSPNSQAAKMRSLLERQREAFHQELPVLAKTRIDRIDRCIDLLLRYEKQICDALNQDFGHRSNQQTRITDIYASLEALKHTRKHLHAWMQDDKRKPQFPFNLLGAKARVLHQPLGVVGIISPWNFPVNLTFSPLAGVLAAGNRAMIKPSELTPATADLLQQMFREAFAPSEITVFTGDAETAAAFSRLPFDHLIFTGSTAVGRHVMRAAADNLVPVTLELGGKSPVILSRNADLSQSLLRILTGKLLNAGQICLAPDYLFVPSERIEAAIQLCQEHTRAMYPTMLNNPDYTSVVHPRHHQRLQRYLDDARDKGARIIEINPAKEDFSQQKAQKMPLYLVLHTTDDMLVMQEEIFGPILPILPYERIDDTIAYINQRPRPLALYFFGENPEECDHVLQRTPSGGVTVNDVVLHVSIDDLPFGGVGASGMGAYHGFDGFKTFSHSRAVLTQSKLVDISGFFRPPYGPKVERLLKLFIRK